VERSGESDRGEVIYRIKVTDEMAQLRFDLLLESEVALNDVVEQIRHKSEVVVEIRGYTDSRGSHEYNLALSTRRAQSVKEYLMRQ
jgi:outer membrane protein OmpA-like peptidoglycan-associated protein